VRDASPREVQNVIVTSTRTLYRTACPNDTAITMRRWISSA
jgi:hypothetical protein